MEVILWMKLLFTQRVNAVASKLLEDIGYTAKDVGKEVLVRRLDGINLDEYSKKLGVVSTHLKILLSV